MEEVFKSPRGFPNKPRRVRNFNSSYPVDELVLLAEALAKFRKENLKGGGECTSEALPQSPTQTQSPTRGQTSVAAPSTPMQTVGPDPLASSPTMSMATTIRNLRCLSTPELPGPSPATGACGDSSTAAAASSLFPATPSPGRSPIALMHWSPLTSSSSSDSSDSSTSSSCGVAAIDYDSDAATDGGWPSSDDEEAEEVVPPGASRSAPSEACSPLAPAPPDAWKGRACLLGGPGSLPGGSAAGDPAGDGPCAGSARF